MIFLSESQVTELEIKQTFHLPRAIDTLISVDVEPSDLIETKEGLRGTLDVLITFEPAREIEDFDNNDRNVLLITDMRETETNEVRAYFSFPIELFGAKQANTNLVVHELDYVLPTRQLFTLKALIHVMNTNQQRDAPSDKISLASSEREWIEKDTETDYLNEEPLKNDLTDYQIADGDEIEVMLKTESKKTVNQPSKASVVEENNHQLSSQLNEIVEPSLREDLAGEKATHNHDSLDEHTLSMSSDHCLKEETEVTQSSTHDTSRLEDNVLYERYGLNNLANPHVKLRCLITKEATTLTEICETHRLDVTNVKQINPKIEESVSVGQVLILPDHHV